MIRKRYIILLAAALMSVQGACAQNASAEVPRHVVAFYNVEDLFDTEDDPLAADEDMLPLADRGWTEERYEAKLQSLARVVAQMGEEYGFPALIGMAEVENRAVMEDLAAQPCRFARQPRYRRGFSISARRTACRYVPYC